MPLHGNPEDWIGKSFIAHNPRVIVKVVEIRRRLLVLEYLGGDGPLMPQRLVYDKAAFAQDYEPYDPKIHGPITQAAVTRKDVH